MGPKLRVILKPKIIILEGFHRQRRKNEKNNLQKFLKKLTLFRPMGGDGERRNADKDFFKGILFKKKKKGGEACLSRQNNMKKQFS